MKADKEYSTLYDYESDLKFELKILEEKQNVLHDIKLIIENLNLGYSDADAYFRSCDFDPDCTLDDEPEYVHGEIARTIIIKAIQKYNLSNDLINLIVNDTLETYLEDYYSPDGGYNYYESTDLYNEIERKYLN